MYVMLIYILTNDTSENGAQKIKIRIIERNQRDTCHGHLSD